MRRLFQKPKIRYLVWGGALGAAAFLLVYGFIPLQVTNDTWFSAGFVERDILQHYAGWLFYRTAPWQWPLAVASNIGAPAGTYIGFTDSIPIAALFFKVLSPLLPDTFQYFGLWALLCSILQGMAACLLLSLFCDKLQRVLPLSLLFIFAPVFLERQLRHTALGSQWLILFSLYLYFSARRSGRYFTLAFPILGMLAMGIHPYFVPMVLAVLFALLAGIVMDSKTWKKPLAFLALNIAAILAFGACLGAFHGGSGSGNTGYGYYAMNLNALFNPASLGYNWSLFVREFGQTLGNYESFNYLGLGLLAAWAVIAVDGLVHYKGVAARTQLRRHLPLALVCLCLSIFAISNTITFFSHVLFVIPLPQKLLAICSILRSSGRLFWPVWYLLALVPCIYALRRPAVRWRPVVAIILVALQLLDLSPALLQKHRTLSEGQFVDSQQGYATSFWQGVPSWFNHIASLDARHITDGYGLALFAAKNNMSTDILFAARFDEVAVQRRAAQHYAALQNGLLEPGVLYITDDLRIFEDLAPTFPATVFCAKVNDNCFVFAATGTAFPGYNGSDVILFSDYKLHAASFTDDYWLDGVFRPNPQMVCFYDTAFARQQLDGVNVLKAGGDRFTIVECSFNDPGWILVTLNRQAPADIAQLPIIPVYDEALPLPTIIPT